MKGFSLLEIMVTVSIVGIMAGSVVVGFNSFADTVRVRETAGVITDTIKNSELEMIRKEYKKQTLHFEEDMMFMEAEVEGQTLKLDWGGVGSGGMPPDCPMGEVILEIDNVGMDPMFLAKRDQYGNNLQIDSFPPGFSTICIPFLSSEDREWQYQAFQSGEVSQVIRLLHFNLRRGDGEEQVKITSGNQFSLEISAPYAAKQFLENGAPTSGTVELTMEYLGSDPETLNLQE